MLPSLQSEKGPINMLVRALLRFPEIYTVTLNLPSATCRLSYMIRSTLNPEEEQNLRRHLQEALKTFYFLNRYAEEPSFKIAQKRYGNLTQVQLTLSYDQLLGKIISLLTMSIQDLFPDALITENRAADEELSVEREYTEKQLIPEYSIDRRQSNYFIAFRDSGRVFIFDK